MGAFARNVLSELRQEVQRREDLIVPLGARLHAVPTRIGERAARCLLRLVDHLPRLAHLYESSQTEGAARHVLQQSLDARLVACAEQHRLIHAQAAVLPAAHSLDDLWFDLALGQIQGKDRFLPGDLEPIEIEFGQCHKIPRGGRRRTSRGGSRGSGPVQNLPAGRRTYWQSGTAIRPRMAAKG